MTIDLYLGEDASHGAVPSNDESTAFDAHELAAIKRFLLVDSIGLGDLIAGVAQQRESECILFDELLMGGRAISAHTDDQGSGGS